MPAGRSIPLALGVPLGHGTRQRTRTWQIGGGVARQRKMRRPACEPAAAGAERLRGEFYGNGRSCRCGAWFHGGARLIGAIPCILFCGKSKSADCCPNALALFWMAGVFDEAAGSC